ncbi:MAG: hypothetical protein D6794_07710 [Deltaproteobacteria bacterium]|nr:MAG: hypothetical protein D6794_07710 [Deltaproteobacteria bacterium]
MTGIIFLSVPDELQLSGDGFHRVSLQPTAANSQLFHTFSLDMNVLARIVKEGDNFNLYLDKIDPERNSAVFSQKLALGMLLNPMFLYQEGKLYIVSSLPKKKMEIRSIPLRSPITN